MPALPFLQRALLSGALVLLLLTPAKAEDPPLKKLAHWSGTSDDAPLALAFAPDDSVLVLGGSPIKGGRNRKNDGKSEVRSFGLMPNDITPNGLLKHGPFSVDVGAGRLVFSLGFSPDGKTLAVGTNLGNVQDKAGGLQLWDANPAKRRSVPYHHDGLGLLVSSLAYSPDGKLLAIAEHLQIHVLDAKTEKLLASMPKVRHVLHAVEFSPNNKFLAWMCADAIDIWDVAKNKVHCSVPRTKNHTFQSLTFSTDDRYIAVSEVPSATIDRPPGSPELKADEKKSLITVWDVSQPKPASKAVLEAQAKTVVFISPTTLIVPSADGLKAWDIANPKPTVVDPRAKTSELLLKLSPSRKLLAASGPTGFGGMVYEVSQSTSRK